MSHRTLKTNANVTVNHSHEEQIWGELTAQQIATIKSNVQTDYPAAQTINYVHLDHSSTELGPTRKYNCWGFTFNPRQCWISSGQDVQNILNANGTQVYPPNLRLGDVICYRLNGNITHTGRVWSIDAAGNASLIQSKWGAWGEYLHPPLVVPSSYGTDISYWRVTPLMGKGDAWHKDNLADDRLPFPPGVKWLSPDLWCNNSGGTTHQNPIRNQSNSLYARLHNPDTLTINNANIRFYWADPNGGIPHTGWNLIGADSVTVTSGNSAVAGPVPWTPDNTVPAHSCLLAIADTGDDYHAAATQDPIVWPYDIARDNNIIQKNISVITLPPAPSPQPLPFDAFNPFEIELPIEIKIEYKRIELRELASLNLDLGKLYPILKKTIRRPRKTAQIIRTRPAISLELLTKGELKQFNNVMVPPWGAVLRTAPVSFGKGERLKFKITALKAARPGQTYRIDFEQKVGGVVTGGMTYVIVIVPKGKP